MVITGNKSPLVGEWAENRGFHIGAQIPMNGYQILVGGISTSGSDHYSEQHLNGLYSGISMKLNFIEHQGRPVLGISSDIALGYWFIHEKNDLEPVTRTAPPPENIACPGGLLSLGMFFQYRNLSMVPSYWHMFGGNSRGFFQSGYVTLSLQYSIGDARNG